MRQRDARDIRFRRELYRLLHDRIEAGKKQPQPCPAMGDDWYTAELQRVLGGRGMPTGFVQVVSSIAVSLLLLSMVSVSSSCAIWLICWMFGVR